MLRGQRIHRNVRTPLTKNPLATLIQSVAVAFLHHIFQQAPDGFYPIHQLVEFRKFLPGESSPSFGSPGDSAETEKQLPDLVQRKTELARALDDRQAIERCLVVASLPAHSHSGRKEPDSLVVANRGGLQANLPGDLGNRQWRHDCILRLGHPNCQFELTRRFENTPCLKVDFKLHRVQRRLLSTTNRGALRDRPGRPIGQVVIRIHILAELIDACILAAGRWQYERYNLYEPAAEFARFP